MSRRSKGPRLHLRSGRIHSRTGKPIPDIYYIRDGQVEISTGCGPDGLGGPEGAEAQLAAYILQKSAVRAQEEEAVDDRQRRSDPAAVLIAEVLALYLAEKAPTLADPAATDVRVQALMRFFGGAIFLSDVRRSTCQAYVAERITQPLKQARRGAALDKRVTPQGARRELEDLSAAIHYWNGEYPLTVRPKVWLPDKPESPRDALTRGQVAALLMAARGYRLEVDDDGVRTWRYLGGSVRANRAHLRRFLVMGVYSGSRPTVNMQVLWSESPVQAWVDLDAGMIWRRGKREKDHKTKRRPVVRITQRLLAHMRRWKALDDKKAAKLREEGLEMANTVLHHGGAPIDSVRTGFEAIVADASLAAEITPHWLRHTCCTWLMERDAKSWDAASFTGMTMKSLEDNYGHHRPSHQSGARKALS